jgi:DNA-binding response OmpR family regulator
LTSPHAKTVLIVEDDRPIAEIIERILTETGYRCVQAGDGGEALAYIENHGVPDAVVLDWMMPHVTGAQFLDAFRRDHPVTPVIVISALDLRRRSLPVAAVLQKPFEFRQLIAAIENSLVGQP